MNSITPLSENEIKQDGSMPSTGAASGRNSTRRESGNIRIESASDNSSLMYLMSPEFDAWLTEQFGRDIRLLPRKK